MLTSLRIESILYNNEYTDALTLDRMPTGSIVALIRQIRIQDLSIFDKDPKRKPCTYVLIHPETKEFMTREDIPLVFSYLADNGYTIDTQTTKLYKTYAKALVCLFSSP